MKRFVDIRHANICGARFAWYDTVTDIFETHSDETTWDTWDQFESDYEGDQLERYRGLTPEWAFQQPNDQIDAALVCIPDRLRELADRLQEQVEYLADDKQPDGPTPPPNDPRQT